MGECARFAYIVLFSCCNITLDQTSQPSTHFEILPSVDVATFHRKKTFLPYYGRTKRKGYAYRTLSMYVCMYVCEMVCYLVQPNLQNRFNK